MTAFEIKKLIEKHDGSEERHRFLKMCEEGRAYYQNINDIKQKYKKAKEHPLRTADNRISLNWHGLLTDQKTGYMFEKEPNIDTGSKKTNQAMQEVLGDEWAKMLKELTVEASNCGIAWLHYWVDDAGNFQYGKVPAEQIIPIYSNDLKERLQAVIRRYSEIDEGGRTYTVVEYWSEIECAYFRNQNGIYSELTINKDRTSYVIGHPLGAVPFVYFKNNDMKLYDLYMYKDLVDKLDESISEFANDIDDVQEIVFVLEGYGGEELTEFMNDLKIFKAVKVDSDGDVRTIKAEIPTEARKEMFSQLKEAIFLFGMGINPNRENFGDSSGVALKFLYSLLELKASKTRSEFDCSIRVFVRAILKYLGIGETKISTTYYKNMISNDTEVVDILTKSKEIISDETRTKNHPYTEDLDKELEQIKNKKAALNDYDPNFGKSVGVDINE